MVQNDPKWSKMVQNCPIFLNMVKYDLIWSNMVQVVYLRSSKWVRHNKSPGLIVNIKMDKPLHPHPFVYLMLKIKSFAHYNANLSITLVRGSYPSAQLNKYK